MTLPPKSIGILGGSFDPVHNGHISIAKSFLRSDYIDELWVLLTPDPPHKTNKSLADYESRLTMLQTAFEEIEGVKVSDLEKYLSQPSYTIQTLQHLQEKFPQHNFFLCLGEDSFQDFKKWKDWQQILTYSELLVAKRPGMDTKSIDVLINAHAHFIDHDSIGISSTEVRKATAEGRDISTMVPKRVKKIITEKKLYS